ncbi:MAG: hypothetical protein P8105_10230 [Dehalococcoidia bacterium]
MIDGWLFILTMCIPVIAGIVLIILTVKRVEKGLLKKFLLTTGASVVGIPVFIILHNLIYGAFIHFFGKGFWNGGDEPFFFIMAVIVCPLGFLVGFIGSIVLAVKRSRQKRDS